MMLEDSLTQTLIAQMRIYLCGAHMLVAQHHLYGTQVGATLQQFAKVCRKVCGEMVFSMPAASACRFTIISIMVRVR